MNKFLLSLCFVLTLSSGLMAMDTTDQNPEELINQFSNAIGDGDYPKVEALLKSGALANTRESWTGETFLHGSALLGQKKICELLLAHNAQVDAKDNDGQTPLFNAVARGHKDVCELLIQNNAQIDGKDINGKTILRLATTLGYDDICKLLIDAMIHKQREFQKNKQAITILLGIRKKSDPLKLIAKDMVQYIARMMFNIAAEDNIDPIVQINEIPWGDDRTKLMDYYHTKLN